jgi:hypothetical protein
MDRKFVKILAVISSILLIISIVLGIYILKLKSTIATNKIINAQDYASSLVPYRKNSLWGFAEKSGKIVIEPQFEDVWFFTDGLAKVRVKTFTALLIQKETL